MQDSPESRNGPNNKDKVAVVLPCSPDAFRDFVAGLLGNPQEIQGGKFGSFSIGRNEIEQTYHLVAQRVFQQHGVHPIGFAVRIVYNNGTSIELNSFNDFQAFYEPKPVISTECHITLSYLIQFPISSAPEKQDITVSFISSQNSNAATLPIAAIAKSTTELMARGFINYRIRYTARTWGADIEGLLQNHVEHLIERETPLRSFMRRNSLAIGLITGSIAFSTLYYGQSVLAEHAIIDQLNASAGLFGKDVSADVKLDSIIRMLVSGTGTRISELSARFIGIGAVLSMILAIYVGTKADGRKPSFVVLTKRAEDEKEVVLEKYKKNWIKLWASIVGGLVLGICSNFVYDYFVKQAIAEVMKGPAYVNVEAKK